MTKINQLIKDVNLIVRNEIIRAEFSLLREYGYSSKESIKRLAEKPFKASDGSIYYLTEKGIENIIYGKKEL